MKKTLMSVVLCITVLALAATALAADNGMVLSKDGRMTISTHPVVNSQRYVDDNAGLTTIYDNLGGHYPDGVYWCCTGGTIFGPLNTLESGVEIWGAVAFTPATSLSVHKISVSVGYVNYGEKYSDILLTLANDNGGIPGTKIKTWKVTTLPGFGSCCTVDTKSDAAGIPVTAGTQYWITVTTESKSDIWAAWNEDDTKQIYPADAVNQASWCKTSGSNCGSNNGVWAPYSTAPGFGFGVWGK